MIRQAIVAGQFYPAKKEELIAMLDKITSNFEPESNANKLMGLVVPHAGYVYSGAVAAKAFKTLCSERCPETVVIIGPNHTGLGSMVSAYPEGYWKTPLGNAKIDEDFSTYLNKNCTILDNNVASHDAEHSIEVQIPFLQYLCDDFKIVPISMSLQDYKTATEVANAIYDAKEDLNRDIIVIASSDFSHYIPHEQAQKIDKELIQLILDFKAKELLDTIHKNSYTPCGYGPIATMLEYCKLEKCQHTKLIDYKTSGDIIGDKSAVVGYAAIEVRK